jgi:type I site-specific restriction-modification system R (restriction) subunit
MDVIPSAGETKTVIEQVSAGAIFAIVALGGMGTALYSFMSGLRSKEKPERRVIEAAEITDTSALATKLTDKITDILRADLMEMFKSGAARDAKIDTILEKLKRIEDEQEIARRARDEVQRQLLERRENDRWRMSAEK